VSGGFVPDSAFCAGLSLPDRDRLNAAIMQVVDDCIVAIDEKGRVIEFNPAAEATFGWSRGDVLGRPLNELIVPRVHRAAHEAGFARYLATGEKRMIGRRIETEAMRADGSIFPVEVSIAEVPSSAGRLFAASLRDITERRRMETKRSRELSQLNQVLDALPIGIFVKDREGRYLVANLEARRLNPQPERSWIGLTDLELFRPELAARFRAADEQIWATGRSERKEMMIDYIGVEQSFLSGKDILALADGQQAILGFLVDITRARPLRTRSPCSARPCIRP
jgi:two-component system NtrC family sensor kinase